MALKRDTCEQAENYAQYQSLIDHMTLYVYMIEISKPDPFYQHWYISTDAHWRNNNPYSTFTNGERK